MLIESHRGQVVVLLMGMEGCDGTRAATEFLKEYAKEKPDGVAIVRLDVPPPVTEFQAVDPATLPFEHGIDHDRVLATQLDFFYYPTLYIFDGEGEMRFAGGCEPERVKQMVTEILTEQPGQARRIYTPRLPAVGTTAPAFSGTTLDGRTVTLDELRGPQATVLIFAKTECRFTMRAFAGMQQLADDFRDQGVTLAIINRGEPVEHIRPIYAERAPRVPVVIDESCEITYVYGIDAAPFLFILDADGRIATRMPYTFEDAVAALSAVLGLTSEAAPPQSGAG